MTTTESAETRRPRAATRRRLSVVGSLWLVANIGFTFFFLTVATILLDRGVGLGTVALINLLGAIYFGRFLVAPVVDRFGSRRFGHYRGWLLLTQAGLILTLVALSVLDPVANLPGFLALMSLMLLLTLFHDTALNGLVVRLLPPAERGFGNGISMAAASGSMLIGSSGALLLYTHAGWTVTVLCLTAVFLIPFAVLARFTEPPGDPAERAGAPWRELLGYFRHPRMAVWALVVIPVFAVSDWLASAPRAAMLLAAGWTVDRIAVIQSLATAVQIAAALLTGAAITRYGKRRTALVIGVLGAIAVAASFPLAAGSAPLVPTTMAVMGVTVVYAAKITWIATVCMDLARPASAATDFSVPMSIEGVFVTVVNSAGFGLAAAVGFPWLMVLALVLAVVGAAVGPAWVRRYDDPIPVRDKVVAG
ncbi:MFS transporter [Amycolatopsis azurea]|uniref:MFS transporter n=1 Tax=Amycolatopsis azurea TaxID=36819 RepID=UPI0037F4DE77